MIPMLSNSINDNIKFDSFTGENFKQNKIKMPYVYTILLIKRSTLGYFPQCINTLDLMMVN